MADISTTRRLAPGDVGFIFLEHGLTVGEVVVLYVKGGGKNGQHASQSEALNIAATSWIDFKMYNHVYGRRFSNITDTTSYFLNNMERELKEEDWEVYKQRDALKAKLAKVMVRPRKKNKSAWLLDEPEAWNDSYMSSPVLLFPTKVEVHRLHGGRSITSTHVLTIFRRPPPWIWPRAQRFHGQCSSNIVNQKLLSFTFRDGNIVHGPPVYPVARLSNGLSAMDIHRKATDAFRSTKDAKFNKTQLTGLAKKLVTLSQLNLSQRQPEGDDMVSRNMRALKRASDLLIIKASNKAAEEANKFDVDVQELLDRFARHGITVSQELTHPPAATAQVPSPRPTFWRPSPSTILAAFPLRPLVVINNNHINNNTTTLVADNVGNETTVTMENVANNNPNVTNVRGNMENTYYSDVVYEYEE
ncbi:hypothetical protein AB1N83_001670 [Pleurotus pulmonarius]